MLRFNDVTEGRVLLNGVDIRAMPQRAWLFGGTIAENIAYGKPAATREEIIKAAKMAKVDYFIRTMPQGYDTVIENDANNLSVGQRQRLR